MPESEPTSRLRRAVPANRYVIFFGLAGAGLAADLLTKWWVFSWLGMPGERPTWWLWEGVVGFQTSLNEGALFGLGQGMTLWFALFSVLAAGAIFYWLFPAGASRDALLTVALALVIAGIFGNLYDRLGLPGLRWNYPSPLHHVGEPVYAVRDFILVMIYRWPWPNFNLADSMLVCGAGLLIWHALRRDGPPAKPA